MNNDSGEWPVLFGGVGVRVDAWLDTLESDAILLAFLGLAAVFFLRRPIARMVVGVLVALLKRFSISLSDEVTEQLREAVEVLAITFAIYVALEVFNPPELAGGILRRILNSVAIIAVFGTWYQLSGPFASLLRSQKYNPVHVEVDWIQRIAQFAILLFGIASLLKVWQVDISGAMTGVGVLGAGLAIASQDLIRNLTAGMTNMSEKRFQSGDSIELKGQFAGTVERIDLRSTLVVGFDQIPRYVPNSQLSSSVVLNYSAMKHRRVLIQIPLVRDSTRSQIETIRDGLRDYHQSSGDFDLRKDAPNYIYVGEIGPTAVNIMFYARTNGPTYNELVQVTERLTLTILEIVHAAGTELAYPTQTLHVESEIGFDPRKSEIRGGQVDKT